jgi:hypothetical protein
LGRGQRGGLLRDRLLRGSLLRRGLLRRGPPSTAFFTTFFTGAREAVFFATTFLVGVFFVVLALDGIALLLAFLRTVLAEASS